jgi:peptidoglycan/LPS O-acetylase OafA/YrhL
LQRTQKGVSPPHQVKSKLDRAIAQRLTRQAATLRSVTMVRAFLVLALVGLQSIDLSDSFALITETGLWAAPPALMIALFALSGFTLARSIDRHGPRIALRRTAWRLLPAVALVVAGTALVAGAAVTQQRLSLYLSDRETWLYLLNIAGIPRFSLPGVFSFNNVAGVVNANLWVLPTAYVATGVTLLSSMRPSRATIVLLGAAGLAIAIGIILQADLLDLPYARRLAPLLTGPALNSFVGFLAGALAYHQRSLLIIDRRAGALVLAFMVAVAVMGDRRLLQGAIIGPLMVLPIAYLALVACSLAVPLRRDAVRMEPLLWRVLLLSYPVQQFWVAVSFGRQSALVNLAISGPTILLLAGAQWFYVERPLLAQLGGDLGANGGRGDAPTGSVPKFSRRGVVDAVVGAMPALITALVIIGVALIAVMLAVFALQRDPGEY